MGLSDTNPHKNDIYINEYLIVYHIGIRAVNYIALALDPFLDQLIAEDDGEGEGESEGEGEINIIYCLLIAY